MPVVSPATTSVGTAHYYLTNEFAVGSDLGVALSGFDGRTAILAVKGAETGDLSVWVRDMGFQYNLKKCISFKYESFFKTV